MAATLTSANAILKEIYEPRIRQQLNDDAVALKRVEKSSEGVKSDLGGKYVVFPIHTQRNSGVGARRELEQLPTAGQQGYSAAQVNLKYLYGIVRLSGQSMELAKTNAQAFATVLDQEVNGLKTDLVKDCNRQVYGDGSGAVAVAGTATTTTNTFLAVTVMYVQLGEVVDIIDGTTLGNTNPTVKASARNVTAINTATNTVTFDGATVSTAVGDLLVRTGNVNREWTGFGKIISTSGILYNIDPANVPVWKSTVDSNGGTNRALSEGLMINMVDSIRTNGSSVTAIFANLGVRRAYFNLLTQQRRFSNTKEFAGGFTGLTFTTDQGEVPVVVDVDAPKNRMYFVNENELTFYQESDWSFMDRDGSMWQRVVGFDAYEATMFNYSELGTHRRNAHGLISDVTEG